MFLRGRGDRSSQVLALSVLHNERFRILVDLIRLPHLSKHASQVAYNAERRVQLWEQNAREDFKELEELRAIVRAEEEREEARRRAALARGEEVSTASI